MPGQSHQSHAERFIDPYATDDDRLWATLVHIGGLPLIPFSFIIPLIIWLSTRSKSDFVDDHGKESVNFQISLLIWYFAAGVLSLCGIGIILAIAVYVVAIAMTIVNAIRANRGEYVRYPITIRFLG